jgi:hypothetical protein
MLTLRFTAPATSATLASFLAVAFCATAAAQAPYVDAQGREWRQMPGTTSVTWNQLDAIFPNDGVTPAAGSLNGIDVTGYVWATRTQVMELLSGFLPEIADTPTIGGAAYVLPGLGFFGSFKPTFEFYSTFGGYNYLSGWTATESGGGAFVPEVSAEYPVFYGYFNLQAVAAKTSASTTRGAWLFKPAPGPFENLGHSLPGSVGAPGLVGTGTLAPGATTTLKVLSANPNGAALLAIGTSAINLPAYGGVFVPSPDIVIAGLPIDANGALMLSAPWPSGVPSGLSFYFQAWIPDSEGPVGVAATNALRVVAP